MDDLISEFILDREVYCRPRSVEYYQENLQRYLQFLQQSELKLLDPDAYRLYVLHLRQQGITNVSIQTYSRAVKVFYKWCCLHHYTEYDYTENVKWPRSERKIIEPLFADEAAAIDNYLLKTDLFKRNYVIFHLMLDCGIRRGEVMSLTPDNIDFVHGCIMINETKSAYSRVVPIPQLLKDRYGYFREFFRDDITEDMIRTLFTRIKKRTGIKKVHPHLLRHTFGTSFAAQGGNLEYIRLYMGHTDYNTTKLYLHLANLYTFDKDLLYKIDPVFLRHL